MVGRDPSEQEQEVVFRNLASPLSSREHRTPLRAMVLFYGLGQAHCGRSAIDVTPCCASENLALYALPPGLRRDGLEQSMTAITKSGTFDLF